MSTAADKAISAKTAPRGGGACGPSKWRTVPCCIYFYRLAYNENGYFDTFLTYYDNAGIPIPRHQVEPFLHVLAVNARSNLGEYAPVPPTHRHDKKIWRRKSYIAIMLDDPSDSFIGDGIIFYKCDLTSPDNHTFFDGNIINVDVSVRPREKRNVQILWFINHMKNAGGRDLGGKKSEKFCFDFSTSKMPAKGRGGMMGGGGGDAGTNMGGAVPPP